MGSVVYVKEDDLPSEKYTIVGEAEANPREGRISHNSPLGSVLMGKKRGEIVEVKAPDGSFSMKITKIA
jgi:transcription elongation factor GreA